MELDDSIQATLASLLLNNGVATYEWYRRHLRTTRMNQTHLSLKPVDGKLHRIQFPSGKHCMGILQLLVEEMEMTFEEELNFLCSQEKRIVQEMTKPTNGYRHVRLKALYEERNKIMGKRIRMTYFPEGISCDDFSGRGSLISDPLSGAKILVLHECLYSNEREGHADGLGLVGIYVIERVEDNEAVWKPVQEPHGCGPGAFNRYQRFREYMNQARKVALTVPSDVDLGVTKYVYGEASGLPIEVLITGL